MIVFSTNIQSQFSSVDISEVVTLCPSTVYVRLTKQHQMGSLFVHDSVRSPFHYTFNFETTSCSNYSVY